jgi:hypothetical protein
MQDAFSRTKGQTHLDRLLQADDVLIQPYLEAVRTYGERALVFFCGRFSHAVVKKPFDTVLAVRDAPSVAVTATRDEIEVASRALASVPGKPLYARIDLLRDDRGMPRVSEVELIEPALYFGASAEAQAVCAEAIERELKVTSKNTADPPAELVSLRSAPK